MGGWRIPTQRTWVGNRSLVSQLTCVPLEAPARANVIIEFPVGQDHLVSFQDFQSTCHTQMDQISLRVGLRGWSVYVSGRTPMERQVWKPHPVPAAWDLNPPAHMGGVSLCICLHSCSIYLHLFAWVHTGGPGMPPCPVHMLVVGLASVPASPSWPGRGHQLPWASREPFSGGVCEPRLDPGRGVRLRPLRLWIPVDMSPAG